MPTISIRYVTRMLELAQRRGAEPAELLAAAGLPPIAEDQPDVRVPTDAYYRLWGVTMSRLEDPTFPMRLAGHMDSASFDALGFAVTTSATFGDALVRIQRYLPFVTDGASWSVAVEGDTSVLTLTQNGPQRAEQQYVDQFSTAHLVVIGRNLAISFATSSARRCGSTPRAPSYGSPEPLSIFRSRRPTRRWRRSSTGTSSPYSSGRTRSTTS